MATIYYTASSLDGFIATPEHGLAWLLSRDVDPKGPMGFEDFGQRVGATVMGANTYQWLLDNQIKTGGDWPYKVETWITTHRDLPAVGDGIHFHSGEVAELRGDLMAAAGERDIWVVGGGDLAGQFVAAGMLDEVWVQFAPVMLGAGAPLLPRHVELRLLEVSRNRDFVCARLGVQRES